MFMQRVKTGQLVAMVTRKCALTMINLVLTKLLCIKKEVIGTER
jgi:hypothetical protein